MRRGITKSGFQFEIDETIVDDMRFFEKLAKGEDNPLLLPSIAEDFLGAEQKERLYKFLENEKGRVPLEAFGDALGEIMEAAGNEIKNSSSSPAL